MSMGISTTEAAGSALLMHCSAGSGRQWDKLARLLDGGFDVVAPDLHGYGDADPWTGPGPLSLSAEAARAVRALPVDHRRPVHVVGHSYGGAVALRLALDQPQRVASMTLIEPVAFHVLRQGAPRDRRLLGAVREVADAVTEGMLNGDYHGAMGRFVDYWNGAGAWSSTDPETRRQISRHAPKVALDFHALITEDVPLDLYRRRFPFPVQLIRGDRSPEPARRVAEMLGAHIPGSRLLTISGASHMLPVTHAEQVNSIIVGYLESASECERRVA